MNSTTIFNTRSRELCCLVSVTITPSLSITQYNSLLDSETHGLQSVEQIIEIVRDLRPDCEVKYERISRGEPSQN